MNATSHAQNLSVISSFVAIALPACVVHNALKLASICFHDSRQKVGFFARDEDGLNKAQFTAMDSPLRHAVTLEIFTLYPEQRSWLFGQSGLMLGAYKRSRTLARAVKQL